VALKRRIGAVYLSKVRPREFRERDLVLKKVGEAGLDSKLGCKKLFAKELTV